MGEPRALADEDLDRFISTHPGWTVVRIRDENGAPHSELLRQFRFPSFDAVLAFMQAAAPFINEHDHHPTWQNAFRTLDVRLTTWDAGHVISQADCDLASHLDGLFEQFVGAAG